MESFDAIGMMIDQVLDDLTPERAEEIITSISTAFNEFASVGSGASFDSQHVIFVQKAISMSESATETQLQEAVKEFVQDYDTSLSADPDGLFFLPQVSQQFP